MPEQVCEDPDDDKFLACAHATETRFVVSGDKKLLAVSGYTDVKVIQPRNFVDKYLF
ncbi:MAG: PIN domain-containing protein [bacterium]